LNSTGIDYRAHYPPTIADAQLRKETRCRDAGVDCDFVARAENFDELIEKVKKLVHKVK
jgi:hypothetical protein